MFFRADPPAESPRAESNDPLDQVLLGLSDQDPFTIRDACQGVQIFGETGSGKTSGSGRLFALSYLRAGFGGLVLTCNTDEAAMWRQYAAATDRSQDLIFFGPDYPNGFNIVEYETTKGAGIVGLTSNLVDLFLTVSDLTDVRGSGGAGFNEGYWQRELTKLFSSAIDLIRLCGEPVSLEAIYDVILSGPQKLEHVSDDVFKKYSTCGALCTKLKLLQSERKLSIDDAGDAGLVLGYWLKEFPTKDAKPRSSNVGAFTGLADTFLRGLNRRLFSAGTTFEPEMCFDGKIIIIDIPVKRYSNFGIGAQSVFKYCWQKAVERRDVDDYSRPVFLWADEAQYFVGPHDVTFQSTARSSRVCTVYLTQNLPNYKFQLGKSSRNGDSLAMSLIANMATKIFHSNTCAVTNDYAAGLFAKDWAEKHSHGFGYSEGKSNYNRTEQQELLDTILPREFSGMMSGGPENNFIVEGVVNKAGRRFNLSGTNALRVNFSQKT